ncbi:P2R3B-like protein [Mya arenaria]|uniref:P2R3B-like protein n=1 Tax=Mya arenaria TaxID=6604 RepID=A0ABY7G490_MYAAR|nr:P2R3B-like protein [Mya arenaria]
MQMREEVIFESPPVKLPVSFNKNGVKMNNNNHNIYRKVINHNNNNLVRMQDVKSPKTGACIKYVCSKVTLYYNSRIELKWRRALHHCGTCDYGVGKGESTPCGAIHYGMCLPVVDRLSVPQKSPKSPQAASWPASQPAPVSGVRPAVSSQSRVAGQPQQITSVPSSLSSKIFIQTISNGSSNKDSSSVLKDIRDRDLEKENTDINIQNNQLNQTYDTFSTSNKESSRTKKKDNSRPLSNRTSVIQNANLPKFHFPMGRPSDKDTTEEVLLRVSKEFSKFEGGKIFKNQTAVLAKECGLPLYWKCPLFVASGGLKQGFITFPMFSAMWKRINQSCHDLAAKFVMLMAKQGTNYIEEEDLVPFLQDVVDTHPGLTFLQEAPEFHSRYVNTVIARILYCVNRSWTGRITIQELRKSNLLRVLQLLEEEDDINQINEYFSYEHFYVIYCKFWELDKDHDLFIDKTDLARHNEHAISTRMLDRIFSGAVTRGKTFEEGKMSYPEFVWFLLSEEDKKHPTSVEYWFRCMDIDGDGFISMYEMEYFYEEQMQKMEALGIERLPFEDCLCQDLENDAPEPTDWEKYAAEEYEILVAEEGANDQEEIHYEDDFEPDEDDLEGGLSLGGSGEPRPQDPIGRGVKKPAATTDDIYDFSNTGSTY